MKVLFFGHPLLSYIARTNTELVDRFDLKPYDATLRENPIAIVNELRQLDPHVTDLADGSAQSSARACAWALKGILQES